MFCTACSVLCHDWSSDWGYTISVAEPKVTTILQDLGVQFTELLKRDAIADGNAVTCVTGRSIMILAAALSSPRRRRLGRCCRSVVVANRGWREHWATRLESAPRRAFAHGLADLKRVAAT